MKLIDILILGLLTLSLVTCKKELGPDPNHNGNGNGGGVDTIIFVVEGIKVSNGDISEKSFTSVKIKADFSAFTIQSFTVPRYGHVVSKTNPKPDINDNDGKSELFDRTGLGEFSSSIGNLEPGVTYYARVYLQKRDNATGAISYGYHPYSISFTTLNPEAPNVAILDHSDVSATSFKVTGQITDFKGEPVSNHGFVWSKTNPQPTLENSDGKIEKSSANVSTKHDFDGVITGLEPSTTYYVRAFATNTHGVSYKNGNLNTKIEVKTSPPPAPNIKVSAILVSEPNGTGNVNPGEEVHLSIILKNEGDADANGVQASIGNSQHYTILSGQPVSYGTILAGAQKVQEVVIKVENSVLWGTIVNLSVNITDDQGTPWNAPNASSFTVVSPYVVTNGLGFYARFNECSGPSTSSAVGSHTGELFGSQFTTNVYPGTNGCAMNFAAQNETYVQFPTNPLTGYSNASISFWMKTLSGQTSIMSIAENSSSEKLTIYNSRFQSNYMGVSGIFDFDLTNYLDNNWHHFVLVADDGGQSKLYIDGAHKISRAKQFYVTTSSGLYIGRSKYEFFNGSLDNIRIYNRALNPTEVQSIYTSEK